jgi:hypothetical protein
MFGLGRERERERERERVELVSWLRNVTCERKRDVTLEEMLEEMLQVRQR